VNPDLERRPEAVAGGGLGEDRSALSLAKEKSHLTLSYYEVQVTRGGWGPGNPKTIPRKKPGIKTLAIVTVLKKKGAPGGPGKESHQATLWRVFQGTKASKPKQTGERERIMGQSP